MDYHSQLPSEKPNMLPLSICSLIFHLCYNDFIIEKNKDPFSVKTCERRLRPFSTRPAFFRHFPTQPFVHSTFFLFDFFPFGVCHLNTFDICPSTFVHSTFSFFGVFPIRHFSIRHFYGQPKEYIEENLFACCLLVAGRKGLN